MAKKQFKAESKRLLDLMINSIYTHKEIFIRELISNASDAIDKMYYKGLTNKKAKFNKEDYFIKISTDKEARTLTILDTGIGMTKEELEENLGTIAKSGSLAFKEENESKEDYDIIGQFGVGFYSAFMVADKIQVTTRAAGASEAYVWESEGAAGYSIKEAVKDSVGTEIVLTIKENTDDDNYDAYLEVSHLQGLVKKYSDFIRYPIKMEITTSKLKENSETEFEDVTEEVVVNNMIPLWRKNKNELKEEDYIAFYHEKHYGFDQPLKYVHKKVEGLTSFNAVLYIPSHLPFDFYTKEYQKGLELYSSGVMIMQKCADLLPDYFGFVQGLVDSEDLSLNISREILQQDKQLKMIAKQIKNTIKNELLSLLKDDREKYDLFYQSFGKTLKYGIYSDFGAHRETLEELIMFYSSKEEKLVTLKEYLEAMPEEQKYIYYATGESKEKIERLPQTELVKSKGYEIFYLMDEVDEFALKILNKYGEKEFKSVASGDLGLETEEEKEETKELAEANKEMFTVMKEALGDKVKDVRISSRLKSHPVCLSTEGELSIEMEKVLKAMPDSPQIKADKILEINMNHSVFKTLTDAYENDQDKLKLYAELLYNQALLIEGLTIEDPVAFTNDICKLMK